MMMSKVESRKISGEGPGSGRLLRDIEEISKALYLHNAPPKALISSTDRRSKSAGKTRLSESHSKYVDKNLLQNDKKSSIWNWKPLKALTHIRNHRLNCCFLLRVHSIEGLPMNFTGLSLSVHWKRKDEVLSTSSVRVSEAVAKFEETLMHRCSVYVSKSGTQNSSSAKYDPKLFLLYASVVRAPGLDIGKHWIDLTRLLPLTLEELEKERTSSGTWMTSFKLSGKAKGATMNVSFGFSVSEDNLLEFEKVPDLLKGSGTSGNGMLRRLGSVPSNSNRVTHISSPSLDIKVFNEVLPYRGSEITRSITFLYQKLDEEISRDQKEFNLINLDPVESKVESLPEPTVENFGYESDDREFNVVEHGVEFPVKDQLKRKDDTVQSIDGSAIETIDVADIFEDDEAAADEEIDCKSNNEVRGEFKDKPPVEELESFFHDLSIFQSPASDFSLDENKFYEEQYMKAKSSYKEGINSLSFDDVTESVANDFLNLLGNEPNPGSDSEPESPRERLLRQFEKEALASGDPIFNLDAMTKKRDCSDNFALSVLIQGAEMEHDRVNPSLRSRRKAEMLENLETEALMREWGLNERAFINSPRTSSGAFGSPVYLSPQAPPELPSLGDGFGPILQTKGDGFLRTMNPSLFSNAKNGENLIMQVSSSIVLPPAMGSNAREILQRWALIGAAKMSMQANELMPLEDITGKTLQHVAWEAESRMEALERERFLLHESEAGIGRKKVEEMPSRIGSEMENDYVSLCDLAPLAMDKIQYLSIEGLRIQSGMSDDEVPPSIRVQSIGEISASSSQNATLGDIDELIALSISLDEWIRLDSGVIDDERENSSRLSKVFEAHCANGTDVRRYENWGKMSSKTCGYLGNNFTIGLQVLLRDPFRDYEAVGTPMLALIQVERNFMERGTNFQEKENRTKNEEGITRFKITEIHVAGLKVEPGKKQHSGSRWLHSSGIGKTKKRTFLKSNSMVRSSSQLARKVKHEDTLWSISSYVQGAVAKWKELSSLNLHVRNPDIVF